jgi:hypothetical protein
VVDLTGAPLLVVIMMEVAANLVDLAAAATASVKMEVGEVFIHIL